LAVSGSVTISFPVFWEYSFKAASKTAWNREEDGPGWELEDMALVERKVEGRSQTVLLALVNTPPRRGWNACAQPPRKTAKEGD